MDTPSQELAEMIGEIEVENVAGNADDAAQLARNELRNKAARLGASLVLIDSDVGERLPLADAVRVRLVGRAYRAL